ncbi:Transcriptional regulatory protein ZraR [Allorhodopirellula heiligendammensis]|uniref:Transcriptional regulatory protein ZraR n=2 Tax=Allorhodopirellula heiligendammensis TaxID=2714739 RepID=A0A5C6BX25_9BACT|nr:Transcriptional regulatory protein ZraR [Allorhodopirellula heiligendammensis]
MISESRKTLAQPPRHVAATLVGRSTWATRTRAQIRVAAPSRSTVLVTGPTGSGKELIARQLHEESSRGDRPFVPIDCASIAGPLCPSQLFGHVRGAFTGADRESLGCFRAAQGGTIFLDEIGELDSHCQAMLLRVLQERCVVPVGSHREIPVDVRVIAATNRDLDRETARQRFRIDLLYRLRVISLEALPLRDHKEDIEVLSSHILAKLADDSGCSIKPLTAESLAKLHAHDWPGNVRELQNVLERATVFSSDTLIRPESLRIDPMLSGVDHPRVPQPIAPIAPIAPVDADDDVSWSTLAEVESEHIVKTLRMVGFNQSAAARLLNVDRHLLARKMKKYGLLKPDGLF